MTTITFKYDLPDDRLEYDLTHNSSKMYDALSDIAELLRKVEKYNYLEGSYHEKLFDELSKYVYDSGIWEIE